MKKIGYFFQKRYLKPLLPVIFCLLSIKPLLFTWNFLLSNYYLHVTGDKQKANIHYARALHHNQSAYLMEKKEYKELADSLVKCVVLENDIGVVQRFTSKWIHLERLKREYRDNLYFQDVLQRLDKTRNWENLDEVSFELLADRSVNRLTVSILEKIAPRLNSDFIRNLRDFCTWKGNGPLARYLTDTYKLPRRHLYDGIPYKRSLGQLKNILAEKIPLQVPGGQIGKNLLRDPGFRNQGKFYENWFFSDMAGVKPFADASFLLGTQQLKKNPAARLMGFFVKKQRGKVKPRGGMWYRKNLKSEKGIYVFSFDYLTRTGRERPSFWLWKKAGEQWLPPSSEGWKKAVFILDNRSLRFPRLKPLIRIWGTGSAWVDNVFLGRLSRSGGPDKITDPLTIEDCQ